MKGIVHPSQYLKCSRFRSRGFSIIEVISAIVILSIMATLSVNLMSGYKLKQNLTGARQQLMNAMSSAMAAAQRNDVSYVVMFEAGTSNGQYSGTTVKVCEAGRCSGTSNEDAPFFHNITMFSKPKLVSGNLGDVGSDRVIKFTPFGRIQVTGLTADANGYFHLFLKDEEEKILDDMCIGIMFNIMGTMDSIETGTDGGCK